MFKFIAIAVLALVAAVLVYAATKPDDFRVVRSTTIQAPPERIFPLINNLHNWDVWSPYELRDPAMKRNFSGAESGRGAIYEWDGNSEVGAGRMEILDTTEPTRIVIKLDFIRPFEGHNTAEFTLQSIGDTTQVSWVMSGPSPYISKLMGTFFNMDKMIGSDFEAGLASLKKITES